MTAMRIVPDTVRFIARSSRPPDRLPRHPPRLWQVEKQGMQRMVVDGAQR